MIEPFEPLILELQPAKDYEYYVRANIKRLESAVTKPNRDYKAQEQICLKTKKRND